MTELTFNPLGTFKTDAPKGGSVGFYFKVGQYAGHQAILRYAIVHKDNSASQLVEVDGAGVEVLIPENELYEVIEFISGK